MPDKPYSEKLDETLLDATDEVADNDEESSVPPTDNDGESVPHQGRETVEGSAMTADYEPDIASASGAELETRVREALRADGSTSRYAERLYLGNDDGRVIVRGTVEEPQDTESVAAVISNVSGVTDVVDELEVETD